MLPSQAVIDKYELEGDRIIMEIDRWVAIHGALPGRLDELDAEWILGCTDRWTYQLDNGGRMFDLILDPKLVEGWVLRKARNDVWVLDEQY